MTVIELLARQAAEQRELSRAHATEATEAKPLVEQAAEILTARREHIEELEAALDEIKAKLANARAGHQEAADRHAEALAVVADHGREAEAAADAADKLDRLAAGMRDARPVPPHEALAATGLMVEPPKVVEPEAPKAAHLAIPADGPTPPVCRWCGVGVLREHGTWVHIPGGEEECDAPDGEELPFTAVPADPGTVARVARHLPVVAPPAPGEPDPGVTMPDLGPARPPLDPPPGEGTHSHAKPGALSRLTGGWPVVGRKKHDEQDGDDRG